MHTKRFNRDCLWGVVIGFALTLAPGCELLVDFDRSLIPNDASLAEASAEDEGGALQDGGSPDATIGTDAANPDATVSDAAASDAAASDAADSAEEASTDATAPTDGASGDAAGNVGDANDVAPGDGSGGDDAPDAADGT